jgi:hypothetical protein
MNYGLTVMYRILKCYSRTRFWKQRKSLGIFQDIEFSSQDSNPVFSITNLGVLSATPRHEFVADIC